MSESKKNEDPKVYEENAVFGEITLKGWGCKTCNTFYGDDKSVAQYCCCTHRKCNECGELTEKTYLICRKCRDKKEAEKLQARLDKAKEISQVGYENMIYSESHNACYHDIDSYLTRCENDDVDPEEFVFATTFKRFHIDLADIKERVGEEHEIEDFSMTFDFPEHLVKAIKQFNRDAMVQKKNLGSFQCDYTRKLKVEV